MSEPLEPISSPSTLSAGEIHVRTTVAPGASISGLSRRRSAMSSSALLRHFARALWCARTPRPSDPMLPGLGGDFAPNWSALTTSSCPSDSGPVALGLTVDGTACSCSPNGPTPCARDWKDGTSVPHAVKHYERNLREKRGPQFPRWVAFHYGLMPGPIVYEVALGFPEGWTSVEFAPSGTRSSLKSRSGSENV
jgi:hypothetical protein